MNQEESIDHFVVESPVDMVVPELPSSSESPDVEYTSTERQLPSKLIIKTKTATSKIGNTRDKIHYSSSKIHQVVTPTKAAPGKSTFESYNSRTTIRTTTPTSNGNLTPQPTSASSNGSAYSFQTRRTVKNSLDPSASLTTQRQAYYKRRSSAVPELESGLSNSNVRVIKEYQEQEAIVESPSSSNGNASDMMVPNSAPVLPHAQNENVASNYRYIEVNYNDVENNNGNGTSNSKFNGETIVIPPKSPYYTTLDSPNPQRLKSAAYNETSPLTATSPWVDSYTKINSDDDTKGPYFWYSTTQMGGYQSTSVDKMKKIQKGPVPRIVNMYGPYKLGKTLGEGEFGKVKYSVHIQSGQEVAIKLIKKESLTDAVKVGKLAREINIIRSVSHPHIVKLHDVIETKNMIGVVMELASGGELFEYILSRKHLKDHDARRLFAQLVSGVSFLHLSGVVHRDLKLENLLLTKEKNICITDFGFATLSKNMLMTSCGSPCYAAPELVTSHGYVGESADIWSMGVILYAMLAGYLPYDDDPKNPSGTSIPLLYRYILSTELKLPSFISENASDLLKNVIVPNPKNRYRMMNIMEHPWCTLEKRWYEKEYNVYNTKNRGSEIPRVLNVSKVDFHLEKEIFEESFSIDSNNSLLVAPANLTHEPLDPSPLARRCSSDLDKSIVSSSGIERVSTTSKNDHFSEVDSTLEHNLTRNMPSIGELPEDEDSREAPTYMDDYADVLSEDDESVTQLNSVNETTTTTTTKTMESRKSYKSKPDNSLQWDAIAERINLRPDDSCVSNASIVSSLLDFSLLSSQLDESKLTTSGSRRYSDQYVPTYLSELIPEDVKEKKMAPLNMVQVKPFPALSNETKVVPRIDPQRQRTSTYVPRTAATPTRASISSCTGSRAMFSPRKSSLPGSEASAAIKLALKNNRISTKGSKSNVKDCAEADEINANNNPVIVAGSIKSEGETDEVKKRPTLVVEKPRGIQPGPLSAPLVPLGNNFGRTTNLDGKHATHDEAVVMDDFYLNCDDSEIFNINPAGRAQAPLNFQKIKTEGATPTTNKSLKNRLFTAFASPISKDPTVYVTLPRRADADADADGCDVVEKTYFREKKVSGNTNNSAQTSSNASANVNPGNNGSDSAAGNANNRFSIFPFGKRKETASTAITQRTSSTLSSTQTGASTKTASEDAESSSSSGSSTTSATIQAGLNASPATLQAHRNLKIHNGHIDQKTVSSVPPDVLLQMSLATFGKIDPRYQVEVRDDYMVKLTFNNTVEDVVPRATTPSSSTPRVSSVGKHPTDSNSTQRNSKQDLDLKTRTFTSIVQSISKKTKQPAASDPTQQNSPSSPHGSSHSSDSRYAHLAHPSGKSKTVDQGQAERTASPAALSQLRQPRTDSPLVITVEVRKIKNLRGLVTVDVRRIKGDVMEFRRVYQTFTNELHERSKSYVDATNANTTAGVAGPAPQQKQSTKPQQQHAKRHTVTPRLAV